MFYFIHLKHLKGLCSFWLISSGQRVKFTVDRFTVAGFTVIKQLTMMIASELHSLVEIYADRNLIFHPIKIYYLSTNLMKHSLAESISVSQSKINAEMNFFIRIIHFLEHRSAEHSLATTSVRYKFLSRNIHYMGCTCMFNKFCFKKNSKSLVKLKFKKKEFFF